MDGKQNNTPAQPDSRSADVLNEVLQAIRLRSALYCRARMTAPWGFYTHQREDARFHFITSGHCWVEVVGSGDPILLNEGDLVIFTHGQPHIMRDALDSPVEPLLQLLQRNPLDMKKNFLWENGGASTTMLCGGFLLEERTANPLLTTLPSVLVVRASGNGGPSLTSAFHLVEAEMVAGYPGFEAVVARLSDAIFLQAIRASLTQNHDRTPGLVKGLVDPQIGAALQIMHNRLAEPWTIETLAAKVGMSRSAFAARFVQVVSEPPMSYLAQWRLTKTAFWLRSEDAKLADLAARVGYDSEASLGKAFKRHFGIAPGAYRRSHSATG